MKNKAATRLFLFAAMVTFSCSTNELTPSRSMLITLNDWRYDSFTSTDAYLQSYIRYILHDSELHFGADKTSTLTFSGSAAPATYTWSFSPDEKHLTMTNDASSIVYEVTLLDAGNLQFRTTGAINNDYKYVKK